MRYTGPVTQEKNSLSWQGRCNRGFTLIELVIVMIIVGIIAGVMAPLIALPVKGYIDQQRRGGLVDRAQTALNIMSRELRLALPKSVRIRTDGANYVMEFLRTASGGRYRAGGAGDPLSFDDALPDDNSFDVLGQIYCTGVSAGDYLSVGYNGSAIDGSANVGYLGGLPTIKGTLTPITACDTGTNKITFNNTAFPTDSESSNQRFYIVDTPITYLCNPIEGTIRRYHDYEIRDDQNDVDTHNDLTNNPGLPLTNPAESSLVIDSISDCIFSIELGGNQISASITVTDPDSSESVELFEQITIPNGL